MSTRTPTAALGGAAAAGPDAPKAGAGPVRPDPPVGATGPELEPLDALYAGLREVLAAQRRLRARDQADAQADTDALTHAQVHALFHLERQKGRETVGELARHAEVSAATMTSMLDQLELREVIVRERSASDRRVVEVALTHEGRALITAKHARWEAHWRSHLEGLGDEDLATAARVLRRIVAMFDAV